MTYRAALAGVDVGDDGLTFELIAYRGAAVFSRDGWIADVKSRGGVVTQVPGGFFHGIMAGRFGSTRPYVYELPPVWLLVNDGIDAGTYELLDVLNYSGVAEFEENQRQGLVDMASGAAGVVTATPDLLKWVAIGAVALLAVNAVQLVKRNG